jgi:hypothetical protein
MRAIIVIGLIVAGVVCLMGVDGGTVRINGVTTVVGAESGECEGESVEGEFLGCGDGWMTCPVVFTSTHGFSGTATVCLLMGEGGGPEDVIIYIEHDVTSPSGVYIRSGENIIAIGAADSPIYYDFSSVEIALMTSGASVYIGNPTYPNDALVAENICS